MKTYLSKTHTFNTQLGWNVSWLWLLCGIRRKIYKGRELQAAPLFVLHQDGWCTEVLLDTVSLSCQWWCRSWTKKRIIKCISSFSKNKKVIFCVLVPWCVLSLYHFIFFILITVCQDQPAAQHVSMLLFKNKYLKNDFDHVDTNCNTFNVCTVIHSVKDTVQKNGTKTHQTRKTSSKCFVHRLEQWQMCLSESVWGHQCHSRSFAWFCVAQIRGWHQGTESVGMSDR